MINIDRFINAYEYSYFTFLIFFNFWKDLIGLISNFIDIFTFCLYLLKKRKKKRKKKH